ncbi:hypothetical protein K8Q94_01475 [Candidatus Nomurabacteria bacterium]|nr:hypothetical protein [Candidatus Nomurabacteria bacterium]
MIYLFGGDDTKNKRLSFEKFLKQYKNVEVFNINKSDFNEMQIESLYSGAGLFFSKCLVVFNNVFEKEEIQDFILDKLDLIKESGNDFVFIEGKLKKSITDAFKKSRAEINIFELPKQAKEKYDNFILTDDFYRKDKLNLWIHFRQAMDAGVGMEELVGVLFWKAKDMLLKKNMGKFSEAELKNFTSKISYLLPEARKEGRDDQSAFEQFLLEAF